MVHLMEVLTLTCERIHLLPSGLSKHLPVTVGSGIPPGRPQRGSRTVTAGQEFHLPQRLCTK